MSADRVLRSAEFSSPHEYLESLPKSYTDEAGIRKPVPFSMEQMGVMQGFVDGLSEHDVSLTVGGFLVGVHNTFRDLRLWTETARGGVSQKRRAFVFAVEHDLLDLSLVKPHSLGSLELPEIILIGLISESANDVRIMQAIGTIDKYDPKVFNQKRVEFKGFMKALLDKVGLANEFQLIALGIGARRKSEKSKPLS